MSIDNKALRAMLSLCPNDIERLKEDFNRMVPSMEELERCSIELEFKRKPESFDAPVLLPSFPSRPTKNHCKSSHQMANQVYKRRKKNKNKKTHRRK